MTRRAPPWLLLLCACVGEDPAVVNVPPPQDAGREDGGTLVPNDGSTPPDAEPNPNDVVEVSISDDTGCAVLRRGHLWCWGKNNFGELGIAPSPETAHPGGLHYRSTPARVPTLEGVAHVWAGNRTICAVTTEGVLLCWGRNAHGELGHPADGATCSEGNEAAVPCTVTPRAVAGLPAKVAQVTTSNGTTCARLDTGEVYCWGSNDHRIVGPTTQASTSTPVRIRVFTNDVIDVAIGVSPFACAVRADATVWCWGEANAAGQLGHDSALDTETCAGTNDKCSSMPIMVRTSNGPLDKVVVLLEHRHPTRAERKPNRLGGQRRPRQRSRSDDDVLGRRHVPPEKLQRSVDGEPSVRSPPGTSSPSH